LGCEDRRAEAHDLGDGPAVANQLEDLGRDERDGFGMVQLQAARAPLARELAGRKNEQLVDFAWREVHRRSPRAAIIPYWETFAEFRVRSSGFRVQGSRSRSRSRSRSLNSEPGGSIIAAMRTPHLPALALLVAAASGCGSEPAKPAPAAAP